MDYTPSFGRLRVTPSLETISFQSDTFGQELEKHFEVLREIINKTDHRKDVKFSQIPSKKLMEILVFERFGLKVSFNFSSTITAAIMILPLPPHNVLFKDRFDHKDAIKYIEDEIKNLKSNRGTVNLRLARVSGMFSERLHHVFFDLWSNVKVLNLTAAEMVAIVLHEIGHAFTTFEYSDRLESMNQVIADIAKEMYSENRHDVINYKYIKLEDMASSKKPIAFTDLTKDSERVILGRRLFDLYFEESQSQYKDDRYDYTASEQLADQFSARFGYGRHLVSSLEKINRHYHGPHESVFALSIFFDTLLPTFNIISLTFNTLVYVTTPLTVFALALTAITIFMSGDRFKDMTYDDLVTRYKRIRDQYVQMLMDEDLSREEVRPALAAIKEIDASMDKIKQSPNVYAEISNVIFPTHRSAARTVAIQKMLETVILNPLYVKSSEIKMEYPS